LYSDFSPGKKEIFGAFVSSSHSMSICSQGLSNSQSFQVAFGEAHEWVILDGQILIKLSLNALKCSFLIYKQFLNLKTVSNEVEFWGITIPYY